MALKTVVRTSPMTIPMTRLRVLVISKMGKRSTLFLLVDHYGTPTRECQGKKYRPPHLSAGGLYEDFLQGLTLQTLQEQLGLSGSLESAYGALSS